MSMHPSSPSEIYLHCPPECGLLVLWTSHPRANHGALGGPVGPIQQRLGVDKQCTPTCPDVHSQRGMVLAKGR